MPTRAISAKTAGRVGRRVHIASRLSLLAAMIVGPCLSATPQQPLQVPPARTEQAPRNEDPRAEAELQTGIALTRQSRFEEAIQHFLAAQGRVKDEYALGFDLALCYVASSQYQKALPILNDLRSRGYATSDVYSLLAQAFIGNAQPDEAFDAFRRASALNPKNEKLYLFVADAAMDHQYYTLGIDVLTVGIEQLPRSSRLYYQRGVFHTFMDNPDHARDDLEAARKISPGSDISYLAAAQKGMLEGNISETIRVAREGVEKDPTGFVLLTTLGQALIRSGARPGQPEFEEAESALERAVKARPNLAAAQLALGQLYLTAGRFDAAIARLQIVRQLAPDNTAVYSHLARAYQRQGKLKEAKEMLAALDQLNQAKAAKYKSGSPDQKASYMGRP